MTMNDSTPPKRERRWFQFSLRTLLLLTTVFALLLGRWVHQSRQEKMALEALAGRDFSYRYDYQFGAGGGSVGNAPPPGLRWLREPAWEFHFRRVTEVHAITDLSDDELTQIGRFRHLRHLSNTLSVAVISQRIRLTLDNTGICDPVDARISDIGLERIRGLSELEWLVLFYTRITDDGLRNLRNMKDLQLLKIGSPYITDKGVPHLKQLTNLRTLYVDGTAISDVGVAELQRALPNCTIKR
jgi:hypothetical protein